MRLSIDEQFDEAILRDDARQISRMMAPCLVWHPEDGPHAALRIVNQMARLYPAFDVATLRTSQSDLIERGAVYVIESAPAFFLPRPSYA
jgi:hypothetical protein